jgi:hypothetical protein
VLAYADVALRVEMRMLSRNSVTYVFIRIFGTVSGKQPFLQLFPCLFRATLVTMSLTEALTEQMAIREVEDNRDGESEVSSERDECGVPWIAVAAESVAS